MKTYSRIMFVIGIGFGAYLLHKSAVALDAKDYHESIRVLHCAILCFVGALLMEPATSR